MEYTVEETTAPVTGGEWDGLRHVLDLVPGAMLIEDPEEPLLIVPVEADEPAKALLFVDGLAKLLGIELRTGRFCPTPQDDFFRRWVSWEVAGLGVTSVLSVRR